MKNGMKGLVVAAGAFLLSAVCVLTGAEGSTAATGRTDCATGTSTSRKTAGAKAKITIRKKKVAHTRTVLRLEGKKTQRLTGVPVVKSLDKSSQIANIDSYKVYYKDEPVLTVSAFGKDTPLGDGGYYAAEFDITGTTKHVFITGLSAKRVQTIQDEIIASYVDGEKLLLEDLDFIDTEKAGIDGMEDSDLCWAGQVSNMLQYTGWGKKAGFETTDDIMDSFASAFVNEGGYGSAGVGWFFNGINHGLEYTGAPLKKENTGAYLNDYPYDKVAETYELRSKYMPTPGTYSCTQLMKKLLTAMKKGYGTGIDVQYSAGAHALTVFGLVTDTSHKTTERKYYNSIILADSDDDKTFSDDRRNIVNHYMIEPLKLGKNESYGDAKSYKLPDYDMTFGVIQIVKTPSDVKPETDEKATKNKLTTADLCVPRANASTSVAPDAGDDILVAGQKVHISVTYDNLSDAKISGNHTIRVELRDADGKTIQKKEQLEFVNAMEREGGIVSGDFEFDPLSAGKYKVYVKLNAGKELSEAYYCNNSSTTTITVADASTDLSKVKISAKIPDFGEGDCVEAKLTYKGIAALEKAGYEVTADITYLIKNKWRKWIAMEEGAVGDGSVGNSDRVSGTTNGVSPARRISASDDGNTSLPSTFSIFSEGPKAMFRLKIYKKNEPTMYLYSKEYALRYRKLEFEVISGMDTNWFSELPAGATSLAEGEQIRFRIVNSSTYDAGTLTGKYKVSAFSLGPVADETGVEIYPEKKVSLGYGESTDVITINSWKTPLYGPTFFSFSIYCNKSDGSTCEYTGMIADLRVEEKPQTVVNTDEDKDDPYDGAISFREAVKYSAMTGKKVTFDSEINMGDFYVKKTIPVSGKVSIDGYIPGETDACGYGVIINGDWKFPFFEVESGASLSMKGVIMTYGQGKNGGAIENHGGEVSLDRCVIRGCGAKDFGGAIYSDGGSVKLLRSSLMNNTATDGAAIYTRDTAVHILNCAITGNYSGGGEIFDTGDTPCTVVASSFVQNGISDKEGVSIVTGDKLTLIGCALGENSDDVDIDEKVTTYGCFLTEVKKEIPAENHCQVGEKDVVFYLDEYDGTVVEDILDNVMPYDMSVCHNIFVDVGIKKHTGVYIRAKDGKLQYAVDKDTYIDTGLDAAFATNDYKKDMRGKKRGNIYGCTATIYVDPMDRPVTSVSMTLSNKQTAGTPMETKLGRAVTDAMRAQESADVAVVLTGEIKGSLKKGKLSNNQAKKILPDTNTMRIVKLTGKQLLAVLEKSIDLSLKAQKKKKNDNRVLQISGVKVTYKKNNKKGKRIVSLKIGGKKVKLKKQYSVVIDPASALLKTYKQFKKNGEELYTLRSFALVNWLMDPQTKVKKSVNTARYIQK